MLMGGSVNEILLLLPIIAYFLLYPNWGATLYGEVKGADDFKRNFNGMAVAVRAGGVLWKSPPARITGRWTLRPSTKACIE